MDLTLLDATALAAGIQDGAWTSEAVVQAFIEKQRALQPRLNAVAFEGYMQALEEARMRDRETAQGHSRGPLHGVPITIKDWIDVAGLPCAGNMPEHLERRPAMDASSVARLRAAGAIVLAKTTVTADSPVYGKTNHPLNPDYSPTGSSSGEAALIAACGSPLGLGSDSGGSIRQPAHVCGIYGLRPTSGRVPITGHFPPIAALIDPRTVIGPMARSLRDIELAYQLISGPDGLDHTTPPVPLSFAETAPADLKVLWYSHHPEHALHPDIAAALQDAVNQLQHAGLQLESCEPPLLDQVMPLTHRYWQTTESRQADHWEPWEPGSLSGEEVGELYFRWDHFRRTWMQWMTDADLILCPISDQPARPHSEPSGSVAYTATCSLLGWPSLSVPCGKTADGFPIGVQLVAKPWREDQLFQVARWLQ
ncbi:amidase [Deinococcus roseus]|uniref:Amidase n=1 Tax=Deinococcus roseus TaxID=392414 RepID=A0ABQ2DG15_9DEIO|nr:amidase [Deinococcus roseus]GGJ56747.1 amidase [Deinococcus roseus]